MLKIGLRGVYGKPWSRMAGDGTLTTRSDLEMLGQTLVDSVVAEAVKDLAKQGGMRTGRGQPQGLDNVLAGLESYNPLCWNVDDFISLRVACLARGAVLHLEDPEILDLDLAASQKTGLYSAEDRVYHLYGLCLRQAAVEIVDEVSQVSLVKTRAA